MVKAMTKKRRKKNNDKNILFLNERTPFNIHCRFSWASTNLSEILRPTQTVFDKLVLTSERYCVLPQTVFDKLVLPSDRYCVTPPNGLWWASNNLREILCPDPNGLW